jgi:hypothetical protein
MFILNSEIVNIYYVTVSANVDMAFRGVPSHRITGYGNIRGDVGGVTGRGKYAVC